MERFFSLTAQDTQIWTVAGCVVVICIMLWYVQRLRDPHVLERAMAKKKERKDVADVLSAALQDAAVGGKITPTAAKKYNKLVALWFKLPDMTPRKPFRERVAKALSLKRLREMNVTNISAKLNNIRSARLNRKRANVRAKLKA